MVPEIDKYTYRVMWSEEDQELDETPWDTKQAFWDFSFLQ